MFLQKTKRSTLAIMLIMNSLCDSGHAMKQSSLPDDLEQAVTHTDQQPIAMPSGDASANQGTFQAVPTRQVAAPQTVNEYLWRVLTCHLRLYADTPVTPNTTLQPRLMVVQPNSNIEELYDQVENGGGPIVHDRLAPAVGHDRALGGGMMGLEQPRDHFADDVRESRDHYYTRLYCLFDIGEGWLNLAQTLSGLGSGAMSLYITSSGGSSAQDYAPVLLGFNMATMGISLMATYVQQRKKALKERGYEV